MENEKEPSPEQQRQNQVKPYLKYSGLAFQMIGILGVAAWAGMKLDEKMGNKNPWYTMVLMLVAVIAAMYMVIKSVTKP